MKNLQEKLEYQKYFDDLPLNALIDERCLAAVSGKQLSTLRCLRTRGGGPMFIKNGRSVRYLKKSILEFLNSPEVSSTAQYHQERRA